MIRALVSAMPLKFLSCVRCRLAAICLLALGGCSALGPDYDAQRATQVPNQPQVWQSPVAHQGDLNALKDWWQQFNDPVLVELLLAAQEQSNTMAQAALRIAQTRALLVGSNAAALPALSASGGLTRGTYQVGGPVVLATTSQAQLQTSWELDLFGGLARSSEAARARLESQIANWHEARISVAADTANLYTNYRACEQFVSLAQADARSRAQTAKLTEQLAASGFQSPANAALARASAAEGQGRLVGQQTDCDLSIKALVAITGLTETDLRGRLIAQTGQLPKPVMPQVQQVPAQVLAQRPDLAGAERELAAASADIGVREADRLPRLSLLGSIGPINFSTTGLTISATSWSIGPTLSMPVFDAGRRSANLDAALVAYQAAEANYRTQARRAVREVEDALLRLNSLVARQTEAETASSGYRQSLTASEDKFKFGLASVLDLEEVRRLSVNADNILASVRRDRVNAVIALYRAVGGGWTPAESLTLSGLAQTALKDTTLRTAKP
jgi:NodT family efflux transporter outer membrane factor (OMF) lipoprotein